MGSIRTDASARRNGSGRPHLYHRLLRFCEKSWPQALPIVKEARVFYYPVVPHEDMDHAKEPAFWDWCSEHFILPFRVCAMEDLASCLVFYDQDPEASGLSRTRFFIDCISLSRSSDFAFNASLDSGVMSERDAIRRFLSAQVRDADKACIVNVGVLHSIRAYETGREVLGRLLDQFCIHSECGRIEMVGGGKSRIVVRAGGKVDVLGGSMPPAVDVKEDGTLDIITQEDMETMRTEMALRNAVAAIEEFATFHLPGRFIVEQTPVVRKARSQKVADTEETRPYYTCLEPSAIRKRFGIPTSTGAMRVAHERRRHWRTYPDDPEKWPSAHGKRVLIPATWVGPEEQTVGRTHYKVMLDL